MTETSSHPSSPQLSRICFVACDSSGTVAYSHFVMAASLLIPAAAPRHRLRGVSQRDPDPSGGVRLHVVTGKGGTGKTTAAAALALALAADGGRVDRESTRLNSSH